MKPTRYCYSNPPLVNIVTSSGSLQMQFVISENVQTAWGFNASYYIYQNEDIVGNVKIFLIICITMLRYLGRLIRKPAICICEIKGADQLRSSSNREADQRLCFRYTDSTISLLSKSIIIFSACTARFVGSVRKPHCWFSHEAVHLCLQTTPPPHTHTLVVLWINCSFIVCLPKYMSI